MGRDQAFCLLNILNYIRHIPTKKTYPTPNVLSTEDKKPSLTWKELCLHSMSPPHHTFLPTRYPTWSLCCMKLTPPCASELRALSRSFKKLCWWLSAHDGIAFSDHTAASLWALTMEPFCSFSHWNTNLPRIVFYIIHILWDIIAALLRFVVEWSQIYLWK